MPITTHTNEMKLDGATKTSESWNTKLCTISYICFSILSTALHLTHLMAHRFQQQIQIQPFSYSIHSLWLGFSRVKLTPGLETGNLLDSARILTFIFPAVGKRFFQGYNLTFPSPAHPKAIMQSHNCSCWIPNHEILQWVVRAHGSKSNQTHISVQRCVPWSWCLLVLGKSTQLHGQKCEV